MCLKCSKRTLIKIGSENLSFEKNYTSGIFFISLSKLDSFVVGEQKPDENESRSK